MFNTEVHREVHTSLTHTEEFCFPNTSGVAVDTHMKFEEVVFPVLLDWVSEGYDRMLQEGVGDMCQGT